MKPIAKDTPVGTRVLVVFTSGDSVRDVQRFVTAGAVREFDDNMPGLYVEIAGLVGLISCSRVYLDEPTPGTWAWACEQMDRGERLRFPEMLPGYWVELDRTLKRLTISTGQAFIVYSSDIRRTDWEIAP